MKESLTRVERVRGKKEFDRIFRNPDYSAGSPSGRLVAKTNNLNYSRFAVTTSRKYGNAVQRNRGKRLLREIYRKSKLSIPSGLDLVIVLYAGKDIYHERENFFMKLVRRAGFEKHPD